MPQPLSAIPSLAPFLSAPKTYALVTGATAGIGYAFAEELAAAGYNVIIHGRNGTKLSTAATSLRATNPAVDVRTLTFDTLATTPSAVHELVASDSALADVVVTVLINNVGGAGGQSSDFKTFADETGAEIDALLSVNLRFGLMLTNALLAGMVARARAGQPGLVVNLGSAAQVGAPYLAVYGASKAFLAAWSTGMRGEMEAEGVDVTFVCAISGSTVSQGNAAEEGMWVPSARTFARRALERAGNARRCGKGVAGWLGSWLVEGGGSYGPAAFLPYWAHRVQMGSLMFMPEWVVRRTFGGIFRDRNGKMQNDFNPKAAGGEHGGVEEGVGLVYSWGKCTTGGGKALSDIGI